MHLIQVCILNAFVLFTKDHPNEKKTYLRYVEDVVSAMVLQNIQKDQQRDKNLIRLTNRQFISEIPSTENRPRPTKRCRICYNKDVRKESGFFARNVHQNQVCVYILKLG
jgi:hypothetical protein